MKHKKSVQFGTTIYREKEFERFCKKRLRNPDFVLGRTKEKILGIDHTVGEEGVDDLLNGVKDISDVLSKKSEDKDLIGGTPNTNKSSPLMQEGMSKGGIESKVASTIPTTQQLWVDKY